MYLEHLLYLEDALQKLIRLLEIVCAKGFNLQEQEATIFAPVSKSLSTLQCSQSSNKRKSSSRLRAL